MKLVDYHLGQHDEYAQPRPSWRKSDGLAEKHYRRRPLDLLRMWHVKIEGWILEQTGIDFVPVPSGLRVVSV